MPVQPVRKKLRHRQRAQIACGARLRGERAGRRCLGTRTRLGRCRLHGGATRNSGPKTPEGRLRALQNLRPFQDAAVWAAYLERTRRQDSSAASEGLRASREIPGQPPLVSARGSVVFESKWEARADAQHVAQKPISDGETPARNDRASARNLGAPRADPADQGEQQP